MAGKIIQISTYFANRQGAETAYEVVHGLGESGKLYILEDEYEDTDGKQTDYPVLTGKKIWTFVDAKFQK